MRRSAVHRNGIVSEPLILAPFYLGLALSLLLLLYHFVISSRNVIKILFAKEADVILGVLG